jgi:hypothetical protein
VASPPRAEPAGSPVPRRYRPLIPFLRPRVLHGPVDTPSLPVRRPWWLLAARRATSWLGRLHTAAAPGVPDTMANAPTRPPPPGATPTRVVPEPVHRLPLVRRHARGVAGAPAGRPGLAAEVRARGRAIHRIDPATAAGTLPMVTRPAASPAVSLAAPGPVGAPTSTRTAAPVAGPHTPAPAEVSLGRVGELPVLGGAPVAVPAGGFDSTGSVSVPAPPASPVAPLPAVPRMHPDGMRTSGAAAGRTVQRAHRSGTGPAAPLLRSTARRAGPATVPIAGPRPSPEARWRAAVASRPLERPRPFPSGLRPLVAALTGGAQRASYTTGPATREALAAAGALGASTGTVVHLPSAPSVGTGPLLGVVAHELAHTRNPVSRPRFMLGIPHGAADGEERAAQAIGQRVQAAGDQLGSMGAGIVGELPVGGAANLGTAARSALAGHLPDVPDLPSLPGVPSLPGIPDVHLPDVALPDVALPGVPDVHLPSSATAALEQAGGAVSHAAAALTGGTPGGGPGGLDIDHLAEVLEQRVLRQIERRGGRYSGMF